MRNGEWNWNSCTREKPKGAYWRRKCETIAVNLQPQVWHQLRAVEQRVQYSVWQHALSTAPSASFPQRLQFSSACSTLIGRALSIRTRSHLTEAAKAQQRSLRLRKLNVKRVQINFTKHGCRWEKPFYSRTNSYDLKYSFITCESTGLLYTCQYACFQHEKEQRAYDSSLSSVLLKHHCLSVQYILKVFLKSEVKLIHMTVLVYGILVQLCIALYFTVYSQVHTYNLLNIALKMCNLKLCFTNWDTNQQLLKFLIFLN